MKYTIEHDIDKGFCLVNVSGELRRPQDSIDLQNVAVEIRSQNGCNRFLYDMSDATIKGSGIKTFEVGVAPLEKGFETDYTIGLVYSGKMDDHMFMENVLVNRGYRVRVFDNVHSAVEWLSSSKDNPVPNHNQLGRDL